MTLRFDKLFWVFLIFSFLGVLIEGFFCLYAYGHWESHVLTVFGWLNFLYGAGAVSFYAGAVKLKSVSFLKKVLILTLAATLMELISGLLLKYGLGMRAWDYSDQLIHFQGIISPAFSLIWALMAGAVCLGCEKMDSSLERHRRTGTRVAAVVLSVFIVINFLLTTATIIRWSERHRGIPAHSQASLLIDRYADDDWMSTRFVEWKFID